MKKKLKEFYVLTWNFNTDTIEHYNVLPYLREQYKERKNSWKKNQKSKRFQKNVEKGYITQGDLKKYYAVPETYDDFKKFINESAMYMFWARCEWEMICHGWPVRKNTYKIDAYEQIRMNLDTICEILWSEITIDLLKK